MHAVSVGEVASALPLIKVLRTQEPLVPLYLSTSTVAGRRFAEQHAGVHVKGIFYCPLDYASCIRRVLRTIKPSLLIVLETEIWPNLYSETKRSGAQLAIVNGRISKRTWPRYRLLRKWLCPILRMPDRILVQSLEDRERYLILGAEEAKVAVAPNLKYAASFTPAQIALNTFGARQVWIAASTVGPNERGSLRRHSVDEDDVVLDAFKSLAADFPALLLILVPRQPARFDEVARKLVARKLNFVRRTTSKSDPSSSIELPGVLLLDTMGELSGAYRFADVAFVGGSIAPRGGHNILEPAAAGVPIIVGPHMENFATIAQDFASAQAFVQLPQGQNLAESVRDVLQNPEQARQLGSRAAQLLEGQRNSTRDIADQLWPLFHSASRRNVYNCFLRALLTPLATLWKKGGIVKRRQAIHFALTARPLATPVISVGGITVGGSGKTPFTVYLIKQLVARGNLPGILMRGYRRQTPAEFLIFGPGTKVPSAVTGDEGQIFLRSVAAPLGIGSKRYEAAQILLRQFPSINVLVMDDGFQHARLERNFDIVLIDGLDPLGGEEVVPLGRLREPLKALERADAFIITRAENDHRFAAIRARLQQLNPEAPVFRTRLIAKSWYGYRDGQIIPSLAGRRVGAFCGLGNPETFWQTLEVLGLDVVFRWRFADHHAYNPVELQRVAHQARAHGADILVTTEKDRINCPNHLENAIAPLDLAWLAIELELEDEARFFTYLDQSLSRSRPKQFAL